MKSEVRTNTLFLMSYCDKDFIADVLRRKTTQIKSYAYILHDKDVYLRNVVSDDGEIIHNKGDKEINHIHLYLELYNSRLPSEIVSWFKCYDDNGKAINTFREYPYSKQSCVEYLTHKNDKDKYQYDVSEVVHFGLSVDNSGNLLVDDKIDISLDIIDSLIQGVTIRTLVKRYGKDFIYHYKQYKDIVIDMLEFNKNGVDFRVNEVKYIIDDDNLPFKDS